MKLPLLAKRLMFSKYKFIFLVARFSVLYAYFKEVKNHVAGFFLLLI